MFNATLRKYDRLEDLQNMIKDPSRAIVMTTDLTQKDVKRIINLGIDLKKVRFVNFGSINVKGMNRIEHENYIAEVLSILLIAKVITEEDLKGEGSPLYRMLAYLLTGYMETAKIDDYIRTFVSISITPASKLSYMINAILKAVRIEKYRIMNPPIQVLCSV